jgi:Sulfotransferase family
MTTAEGVLVETPRPRGARLEAAELVGGVLGHAPDGDGPLRFLPALDRLCSAISDEARLTEAGRRSTRRSLVSALVLQLRLHRLLGEHPEIERLPFDGPLVVAGLFRSGTTLLQNLLAQHPDVRAPQLWELMHPVSRDGSAAERARLIRVTQSYVQAYYRAAPAFRAIHYLDAELPEECHRLTGATFTSDIYPLRYRIPSYVQWLDEQDMRRPYAFHRTLLHCLLWRDPGGHVALKCPTHLWHLDTLAATYPEGRLVRLHRHPVAAVASSCSLTAVVRSARSAEVDPGEIGRYWTERAEAALGTARRSGAVHGLPVLDLRYDDLVRDPLAAVASVCDFAGIRWTGAAERRVRRFLDRNPQGRHGVHRYAPEEFGLSRLDLEERFGDYRKEFGL